MSYYSINKIKNVECNFEWSSKEFWKSDVKIKVQFKKLLGVKNVRLLNCKTLS